MAGAVERLILMPSTYLQIVQTACDELGLNRPAVVINSTDLQIRQLSALMKRDLREIQQNYEWTALQEEFDLHVSPPQYYTGNVSAESYLITNVTPVPSPGTMGSFDLSFDASFQGGAQPIAEILNPPLYVVTGQFIVNDSRLTAVSSANRTFTMDQPATGTATSVTLTVSQDTYPGPIDFDRYINQTWWDRTNRWALIGPDSPQVDQWHRSGIVTIGPRRHWRQIGYNGLTLAGGALNVYRIWPPPGANDTPLNLVYEYISVNTVLSADGTPKPTFTADTDFPILDENVFILGAKWRLWQIKGFDYAAMQQEYQDYVDRRFANDGGAKTLSMVGSRVGLYQSIVQDGNFPGTATSGQ